jgi:hypothetical protein
MSRIRRHLSYANVISTLCLFLLLGGGTAVALGDSNTVESDDPAPAAQALPDVVRAHAFEVVGPGGQVRATLDARGLKLLDTNGTIRVKLGGDVDGSGLLLANERTEVGVHALATRTRTWVAVQRGDRRRVIRP